MTWLWPKKLITVLLQLLFLGIRTNLIMSVMPIVVQGGVEMNSQSPVSAEVSFTQTLVMRMPTVITGSMNDVTSVVKAVRLISIRAPTGARIIFYKYLIRQFNSPQLSTKNHSFEWFLVLSNGLKSAVRT